MVEKIRDKPSEMGGGERERGDFQYILLNKPILSLNNLGV
jgi:hypothetical protein